MSNSTPSPICPICGSADPFPRRALESYRVLRCRNCTVEFLHPQPAPEILESIYTAAYRFGAREGVTEAEIVRQKRRTAEMYVDKLLKITGGKTGSLLEIGCDRGDFLLAAQERGFQVKGVEISEHAAAIANGRLGRAIVEQGDIESVRLPAAQFDVAAFSDVIEHVRDPHNFLRRIHGCLRPGGIVLIATPDTDSWSYRLMRTHWMEYKLEHLFYFNRKSLTTLLNQHGFERITVSPNVKALTFDYIRGHFRRYPVPVWSATVEMAGKIIPAPLSRKMFCIVASGLIAIAHQRTPSSSNRLRVLQ